MMVMFVDDLTIDDTVVGRKPDIRTKIWGQVVNESQK